MEYFLRKRFFYWEMRSEIEIEFTNRCNAEENRYNKWHRYTIRIKLKLEFLEFRKLER